MFAGIPLFMHGREITSLSFTALGFFLVLVAVVLARGLAHHAVQAG